MGCKAIREGGEKNANGLKKTLPTGLAFQERRSKK
jgi:hypothetical protein